MLSQRTIPPLAAAVTDVGRLLEPVAELDFKIFTKSIAHGTLFTKLESARGVTGKTDAALLAGEAKLAGIIVEMPCSRMIFYQTGADLFGNGGRILVQSPGNYTKGSFFLKHTFDGITIL